MSVVPLVSFDSVSVLFDGKPVLDNISFQLLPNQIVTLIGPNGAGKSTFVKTLIGLRKPSSGTVVRQAELRIGYVPQKLKINESLPLRVSRFLLLNKATKTEDVTAALTLVGAAHLLAANMHTLSGGEMQRVLLANAVLKKPNLLVLDEPMQGVDVKGQLDLYNLIAELKQRLACSVLMVSHDLHFVMAKTDEVICLHHHICCQGAPDIVSIHPEYLSRFGNNASEYLALYQHRHNHEHNLAGEPIKPCQH